MEGINLLIERFKISHNYSGYIETIVDFAEEYEVEIEEIVDNIDGNLKRKVEIEFIKNNWFPDKKIENSMEDFLKE